MRAVTGVWKGDEIASKYLILLGKMRAWMGLFQRPFFLF
jgi:hypothetical protein